MDLPKKSKKEDAPTNLQYTEFISVRKQDENTFHFVFDEQTLVTREENVPGKTGLPPLIGFLLTWNPEFVHTLIPNQVIWGKIMIFQVRNPFCTNKNISTVSYKNAIISLFLILMGYAW